MSAGPAPLAPRGLALPVLLGLACGAAVVVDPRLLPVVAAGGLAAWVGVRNPQLLVFLVFVSILFDRLGATGMKVAKLPITASKLAVLGGIGLWGLHALVRRVPLVRGHAVLNALIFFTVITGITTAWADSFDAGRFTLMGLAMVTILAGLCFVILADRDLAPLYRALGAVIVVALAASVAGGSHADAHGRATGTFGDPNEWATLVLLVTPLLLGGLAEDRHPVARLLRLGLIGLAPLAILGSGSRAALMVGLVVGAGSVLVLCNNRGELALCAGGGLVLAPLVVDVGTALERFGRLFGRFTGQAMVNDVSLDERGELLRQGIDLFFDHWLMGAGPGNFARATGFLSLEGRMRPAHNTYLEVAGEQGIVGLAAGAVLFLTVGATLLRAFRAAPDDRHQARVAGAALGLVALAAMSATLGMLTFSMAYLCLGITLAATHQARVAGLEAAAARAGGWQEPGWIPPAPTAAPLDRRPGRDGDDELDENDVYDEHDETAALHGRHGAAGDRAAERAARRAHDRWRAEAATTAVAFWPGGARGR